MYGTRITILTKKLISAAVEGFENADPLRTRIESTAHAADEMIAQSSLRMKWIVFSTTRQRKIANRCQEPLQGRLKTIRLLRKRFAHMI
jgi:hypothetical protein